MDGTELVETENAGGLQPLVFNREQIDLIKRTIAVDASDDELKLFLYTAKRTGLDPLARQIYAVKRKGKMTIQTGIDGYRLIADRTGKYAGNDDPVYDDEDKPQKASVTVYKIVNGIRCPFTASARWDQYYPGEAQGFMWKKMPHLMLGKCAEGLALRKAFPAELSGIYTEDEMSQAGNAQSSAPIQKPQAKAQNESNGDNISEPQRKRFYAIWKKAGKSQEEVKEYLKEIFGSESSKDITKAGYENACKWAEAAPADIEEEPEFG